MKIGIAGSLESNDCLITVYEQKGREIKVESIVYEQFGEAIYQVVEAVLDELKINDIFVSVNDKGALDYTIKARLKTALKRLGENGA